MRKAVERGEIVADRHGRPGGVVRMSFRPDREGEWAGEYAVETRGRGAASIAATLQALEIEHEKRQGRLREFSRKIGTEIRVRGRRYTVATCTLRRRGNNVELYVSLRDEGGVLAPGMPITRVYRDADSVPPLKDIEALITERIDGTVAAHQAHAAEIDAAIRAAGA